jgi:hypothetical protein
MDVERAIGPRALITRDCPYVSQALLVAISATNGPIGPQVFRQHP